MASRPTVVLKVVSDNVCPWCFVGKRNMETAIKQFDSKLDVQVEYFPYSLHGNTMPDEGMSLADYIYRVYRRKMDVNDPNSPLKLAGERVGIKFNNSRTMVNTLDSHRLITLAKDYGKHLDMVEAIFHEYFENAVNISQLDSLQKIAEPILSGNMTSDEIKSFLEGSQYKDKVLSEIDNAKNNYISGVPYFTIYNPTTKKSDGFSGAQPPDRFIHTFNQIVESSSSL